MAKISDIEGIGPADAKKLAGAGVSTTGRLLTDLNAAEQLVRQVPSVDQVKDWVSQAATLPRVISH